MSVASNKRGPKHRVLGGNAVEDEACVLHINAASSVQVEERIRNVIGALQAALDGSSMGSRPARDGPHFPAGLQDARHGVFIWSGASGGHLSEHGPGAGVVAAGCVAGYHGGPGDDVWLGHFVEQVAGGVDEASLEVRLEEVSDESSGGLGEKW